MVRKLASIQQIGKISPIAGADLIVATEVLGWVCVTKKSEFREGDLCIYFEIDSLLPDWPQYERLRKSSWQPKLNKYLLKTCKLRGVISQGLCLPIDDFQEHLPSDLELVEGTNLTEILGIEKHEDPMTFTPGDFNSDFRWPISKTDEPRMQSMPKLINLITDQPYYISVKLDGTSASFIFRGGIRFDQDERESQGLTETNVEIGSKTSAITTKLGSQFSVCSRNNEIKEPTVESSKPENVYWEMAKKYEIQERLEQHYLETGESLSIQGEICGPRIQKNRLNLKENCLFIFNIVDSWRNRKLPFQYAQELLQKWGLPSVPIVHSRDNFQLSRDQLFELSNDKYAKWFPSAHKSTKMEGIVVRSQDMSISFKVINNEYLLK